MKDDVSGDAPIFLVGFMGAGKTTVGRALAVHLGYDFFDLDELIAGRIGKSVQEIFAEHGEEGFRRLESEAIQSCRSMVGAVIALGGGAYVPCENRASIRAMGKSVWLDCPLEICLKRIAGDRLRPLLGDEESMKTLLAERAAAYARADFVVRGDHSPEEVAAEIIRRLAR